ncbi:unnamed protein product [Auanema sp. JU1783]|nr:unnamed protein product [Auanema sp. JU1783]
MERDEREDDHDLLQELKKSRLRLKYNWENLFKKYENITESGIEVQLDTFEVYAPVGMDRKIVVKEVEKHEFLGSQFGASVFSAPGNEDSLEGCHPKIVEKCRKMDKEFSKINSLLAVVPHRQKLIRGPNRGRKFFIRKTIREDFIGMKSPYHQRLPLIAIDAGMSDGPIPPRALQAIEGPKELEAPESLAVVCASAGQGIPNIITPSIILNDGLSDGPLNLSSLYEDEPSTSSPPEIQNISFEPIEFEIVCENLKIRGDSAKTEEKPRTAVKRTSTESFGNEVDAKKLKKDDETQSVNGVGLDISLDLSSLQETYSLNDNFWTKASCENIISDIVQYESKARSLCGVPLSDMVSGESLLANWARFSVEGIEYCSDGQDYVSREERRLLSNARRRNSFLARAVMSKDWFLDVTLQQFVADESHIDTRKAINLVKLFEEGDEIAYIARYRGDAHGGLSCDQLRKTFETYKEAKDLNKKVEKALNVVESKITDPKEKSFAMNRLREAREPKDITDITQTYTSGRKTKADKARELGLGSAAENILSGKTIALQSYINKKSDDLNTLKKVESNIVFCLSDAINRTPETVDFTKEIASLGNRQIRVYVKCDLTNKAKKWTPDCREFGLIKHFETYVAFKKEADRVLGYQILAMERAEEKEVLSWKVEVESDLRRFHPASRIRVHPDHKKLFDTALEDSLTRLLIPKVQRSVKRVLKQKGEAEAIACFSANLVQLFAQEGLEGCYIIALDPGYAACKSAFLSDTGSVIETISFGLRGNSFDRKGQEVLSRWANNCKNKVVIAIGNGTASKETQKAVSEMIKRKDFAKNDVKFCVIPETGASKYSITQLAEAELPNIPITEKSAVSIGRRLLNPMAEYVKIEPKHLGLGMYQHSVNEKKLSEALELVVRQCVSLRGVNINNASLHLLQQVCGLNKKTAEGIIKFRESNGHFTSRKELKDVKGLGPKSFEQSAGFLIITPPEDRFCPDTGESKKKRSKVDYNPLDGTTVHPMHYDVAKKTLKAAKIPLENASNLSENNKTTLKGLEATSTEQSLVIELLTAPPRTVAPPPLQKEVRSASSLTIGEVIFGRVLNQVAFGVFVDIGADCAALAHKNVLVGGQFPEVGTQLLVKVTTVDIARKRISVTPVTVSSFPLC